MTYLVVHYWHFLIAAAGCGAVVGWWAQGSSRQRRLQAAKDQAGSTAP